MSKTERRPLLKVNLDPSGAPPPTRKVRLDKKGKHIYDKHLTPEEFEKVKGVKWDPNMHNVSSVIVHFSPSGKRQLCWVNQANLEEHKKMYDIPEDEHVHLGYVYNTAGEYQWPPCVIPHWDYTDCYDLHPDTKEVIFHKGRAKTFHVEKLREDRNKKLAELDVEFMRNLETNKSNVEVLRKKQILRDMPTHPIWDKCETLDDFYNVTVDHIV